MKLTDAEALAVLSPAARSLIKRKGWVRCKLADNAWHAAEPVTPPDWGNGAKPFAQACACLSARAR